MYSILMIFIFLIGQSALASQASLTSTSTSQFPPLISIFGDKVVSDRLDAVSIQFEYGVSSYDVASSTGQTGLVQSFTSMAIVSTGIGQSATAKISSLQSVPYYPGHDTYVFFTAVFFQGGAANSTQWIGIFSTQDGAAIGYNGATFSILFRQNGEDTITPQSRFNIDQLNGTGPSGYTINPTEINVFRIAFGWLGAAPIKYQILTPQGTWQTFHQILLNNTTNQPTFLNPNLPITMAVANNGNITNVSIGSGSWNGGAIQQPTTVSSRFFSFGSFGTTSTPSTQNFVSSFLNPTTFNGSSNTIQVQIRIFASVPYNSASTPQISLLELYKNATLSGTSYISLNSDAVLQISPTGSFVSGSGTLVLVYPLTNVGGSQAYSNLLLNQNNTIITLNPGDTLTVLIQNITSASSVEIAGNISWQELW